MKYWANVIQSVKSIWSIIALLILAFSAILIFVLPSISESYREVVSIVTILVFLILIVILVLKVAPNKKNILVNSDSERKLNSNIESVLETAREEISVIDDSSIRCQINPILEVINSSYDAASSSTVIKTLDLDILRWRLDSKTKNTYFDLKNKNAIFRGVVIRRVFTIDDDLLKNDDIYRLQLIPSIIEGHIGAGVEAKVLLYSSLLKDEANDDFIVMDKLLAVEHFYSAGSSKNNGIVSYNETKKAKYNTRFDSIWDRASKRLTKSNLSLEINSLYNKVK